MIILKVSIMCVLASCTCVQKHIIVSWSVGKNEANQIEIVYLSMINCRHVFILFFNETNCAGKS